MEKSDIKNIYRQETPTGDCIIGFRIYGQCRQQDCLRPRDSCYAPETDKDALSYPIDSARSAEINNITGFTNAYAAITLTDTISGGDYVGWLQIDNGPVSCRIVPNSFKLNKIKILSVNPSTFGQGNLWDIEVKYIFNYNLEFYDVNNNLLNVVMDKSGEKTSMSAESTYVKKVTLNGGVTSSDSKVVMAGTFFNDTYDAAKPYALVQGEAEPLTIPVNMGVYNVNTKMWIRVDINIGLFTMIKLFRIVNMMVQTIGDCQPEEYTSILTRSPCTQFKNIKFPFCDFDPPTV